MDHTKEIIENTKSMRMVFLLQSGLCARRFSTRNRVALP